ncbi:PREDICTED: uncharacterized protein LOC109344682 [Lupinus angustifolius]|uniref:uncharacterized protein LOC109344682 n=1 Tax=Lupinus angustifolius TaxID=3871 RepID=UPI00092F6FF5|nr:PREDICTED: uncharacterized protein LOC109344682 [Lupinus angustifolius]
MDEGERITDFFTRIITQVNGMKSCGERMEDAAIVEKVLRTVTPKFDHVVVAIEESGRVEKMRIEELQGSLEAHEQRLDERLVERPSHQALQTQTSTKRGNFNVRNFNKNQSKTWDSKGGSRKGVDLQDRLSRRNEGKQSKNWKKRTDKRRIKCYNCDKLGNFASECYASNKNQHQGKQDPEANLAKEEGEDFDDEAVRLMMTTTISKLRNDIWYIDSGCSNHVTGHKDWLVNFDPTKRNKVKFADNRVVTVEGTGDIPLRMQDGRRALITDVLFAPNIKTNLISIGQLHEKGLNMELHNGFLEIYDSKNRRLSAPLSNNRTFQVKLDVVKSQCLNAETNIDESWL